MKHLLFVALGGAGGAVSRYLMSNFIHASLASKFPYATLIVNLLGSLMIGIMYVLIVEKAVLHPDWRSVLMVGFLGAFTTFSTFSIETINLMQNGYLGSALLYIIFSVVVCVFAAWLGVSAARVF
jgi:CrcB protein